MTLSDFSGSGSLIICPRVAGTICQDIPYLSLSQPHCPISPPSESLSHNRSGRRDALKKFSCPEKSAQDETRGTSSRIGNAFHQRIEFHFFRFFRFFAFLGRFVAEHVG